MGARSGDIPALLRDAVAHHQAGRLAEAAGLYKVVLRLQPENHDALHLLGLILAASGQAEAGVQLIKQAVDAIPSAPTARNNLGALLRILGRHQEAAACYERVLVVNPVDAEALHSRGIALQASGRWSQSLTCYSRALAIRSRYAEALNNRGAVLWELGRPEEALADYRQALAVRPDYAEALSNYGFALSHLKRHEEAIRLLDRAMAIRPDFAEALNNRGNSLLALRRCEDAACGYGRALAIRTDYIDAYHNQGIALQLLRRYREALASYSRVIAAQPGHFEALNNRGITLHDMGLHAEAIASYTQALIIQPDYVEALNNRGIALWDLKAYDSAATDFANLLVIKPDYDYAQGYLLHSQLQSCEWRSYSQFKGKVADAVACGVRADVPFSFLITTDSPAHQRQCAKTYVNHKYPAVSPPLWTGETYKHSKIRLAYLSADFHDHATAYLMAGIFESHDKQLFETTAISFGPDVKGAMRDRLKSAFDRFESVQSSSDRDVALLLRKLEADIAVDLKGFTTDARPSILSFRPVPIQVNYLGYPGTTGAPYMDYIMADRIVIPDEHVECYSEKVVYLPDTYQPNDSKRPISARSPTRSEAGLPERGFVFSCFNNNYKITPPIFDIWMRLLQKVEGSVLWLLEDNVGAGRNLRREAQFRGVSPERLVFAPRVTPAAHLARHQLADLFLDTYPCNAHTTASDALWAGLPLVTCSGASFTARVAGSLLNAVGLPELVAHSLEDYESLALTLAQDRDTLATLAKKLAKNRRTWPLFDTNRSRRHIEAAYGIMWERYQRGQPPASFSVRRIV